MLQPLRVERHAEPVVPKNFEQVAACAHGTRRDHPRADRARAPPAPAAPARSSRGACPYDPPRARPARRREPGSPAQRRQHAPQRGHAIPLAPPAAPCRPAGRSRPGSVATLGHLLRPRDERVTAPASPRSGGSSSGTTRSGTNTGASSTSRPRRCASRHCHSRPRLTSCRRATSLNFAPGSSTSARIRNFSSGRQRRRRSTPVMISIPPPPALTGALKNALKISGHRHSGKAALGGWIRRELARLGHSHQGVVHVTPEGPSRSAYRGTDRVQGGCDPEQVEVVLSSDRRRVHLLELRARLVAEMLAGGAVSVISRREGICDGGAGQVG